jgi:hypothetical protein
MADTPNEQSRGFNLVGTTFVGRTIRLVALLGAVAIALVVIVGFVPDPNNGRQVLEPAEREVRAPRAEHARFVPETEEEYEARMEKISAEERAALLARIEREKALREELSEADEDERSRENRRPRRRVRRYQWESPAETRGKLWNVSEEESVDATREAFLRVCISEADGYLQDCIGIWQVIKNIRRSKCERGYVRRITECEEYTKRDGTPGLRETYLSVMRRASKSVLGVVPPRSARSRWISQLTLDCEPPPAWPGTEAQWDSQYGSKRCPRVVELSRYLIKNELPPRRPGVDLQWLPGRPITWGGRCENKRGACDDRIACSRGLARVQQDLTHNAFWCQPGRSGCREDAEPICVQLGYGHLVAQEDENEEESQTEEPATQEDEQVEAQSEEAEPATVPVAVSEPSEESTEDPS